MSTSKTWNGSAVSIPAASERNWASLSDFLAALADYAQTTNFQKVGMRVAVATPVTIASTSDCIVVTDLSVAGAVTVNLPAGVTGQVFMIVDGKGDAATNNITVDGNSTEAINGAATYVISKNRGGVVIGFNGTGWNVLAEFTAVSSSSGVITVQDANFTIQDNGDATKQLKFQLSGITTGNTRTLTVPDASTTLVGTDTTQTLSGKTLVAPVLGTPASGTLTNCDGLPVTSITGMAANVGTFLLTPSSANLRAALTDETGTGAAVFATSPALTTPDIGTPSAAVLTNATGLPVSTGISGLGTGVATFLATPTSANLRSAMTDETGTGANVFADTPTLIAPILGTPTSATLTNATGLPISTGVSGLGSNVATFLATPSSANLRGALTDETGTGAAVFGTAPTIVTPLIDDYLEINEEAAPSTPASGKGRLYVSTAGKLKFLNDDGVTTELGASSGNGEKNYITNPSALADITGWTAVGDFTVARSTTAAELPREYTTATGIKILASSGTQSAADYVYYDFTLDDVELSKKLKIQWSQKVIGTLLGTNLAVVITTQADRTTALHTPVVTAIPATDYVFQTSFDAGTTAALSLVIRGTAVDMTTGDGLVISDVVVGPDTRASSSVVQDLGSLAFTLSNVGSKTFTNGFKCYRVGSRLKVQFSLDGNATATGANDGSAVTLTLPAGYTIDATQMPTGALNGGLDTIGFWQGYGITTSAVYDEMFAIYPASSTTIKFIYDNASAVLLKDNLNGARDMNISGQFDIPILEWSGSGTMNVIQDNTLDEWSSFTPTGSWTTNATYTGVRRRVGDTLECAVTVSLGGATDATGLTVNLPSGLTIDTTKVTSTQGSSENFGAGTALDVTTRAYPLVVAYNSTTSVIVYSAETTGNTTSGVENDSPFTFGSGDKVSIRFSVPILEWRGRSGTGPVGFAMADASGNAGLVNPYSSSSGVVTSGTYTATGVAGANVSGTPTFVGQWMRVGKVVTVSGQGDIDPTSASTFSTFTLTLPVAATFSGTTQAGGSFAKDDANAPFTIFGYVKSTNAASTVTVSFYPGTDVASRQYWANFTYQIP